ncbi:unnamed protein product, partial [Medioppia subpectinata]
VGAKPYSRVCRYGGRLYQLGWQVPIAGEPCAQCQCDEHWDDNNPLDSLSCGRVDCEPDLQIKLKAGCRPLYSSHECCPVDYYCGPQCVFNGTRYPLDTKLYLSHTSGDGTCDECRCSAPPHFTCVNSVCTARIGHKLLQLKSIR